MYLYPVARRLVEGAGYDVSGNRENDSVERFG
jgi:hypothetical protein